MYILKIFKLLSLVTLLASGSLHAMLPAMVSVVARNLNKIQTRTVAHSTAKSPELWRFVQKSAAIIKTPCLKPLQVQLSQYASRVNQIKNPKSITQVWQQGLEKSYNKTLLDIKVAGKLTNYQWQSFNKYRQIIYQKNSLSHSQSNGKPGEFSIHAGLMVHFPELVLEFAKKIPHSSNLYIDCCDDTLAKSTQLLLDKDGNICGGQKYASLAKIKKMDSIVNVMHIACSEPLLQNNPDVFWHCLQHELQHLIHNDALISQYLQSHFKNRISLQSLMKLNHVIEYRADLLSGIKDLDTASLVVQSLSALSGQFNGLFSSLVTNSHPSYDDRITLAKLLREHLYAEDTLKTH